jgi:hypothetical protein
MKRSSLILWIASAMIVVGMNGCSKDPAKPVISGFELGKDNSMIAKQGGDLHVEAKIEAEGKIDVIIVDIHYEGTGEGWEFEKVYTEFKGLKNTEFHKDIKVPVDAAPGEYHVYFKVRDQQGNEVKVEGEIEIVEP